MDNTASHAQPVRFGSFELIARGELRKQGVKIKLQEQTLSDSGDSARATRPGSYSRGITQPAGPPIRLWISITV